MEAEEIWKKKKRRDHNIWVKDEKQMARDNCWGEEQIGTRNLRECEKVEGGEESVINKQGNGLWEEAHKEHGN